MQLLAVSDDHGCCMLKVKMLEMHGLLWIVSSDTRGRILIWNYDRENNHLKHVQTEQVHQSGINGLDVWVEPSASKVTIATGGDDNALHWREYSLHGLAWHMDKKASKLTGHAGMISGVKFDQGPFLLWSVSLDQRMNGWQLLASKSGSLDWHLQESDYVDIADVSCILVLEGYVIREFISSADQ